LVDNERILARLVFCWYFLDTCTIKTTTRQSATLSSISGFFREGRYTYKFDKLTGSTMRKALFLFAALLFSTSVIAIQSGDHVENFKLLDHQGKSHELYYLSDTKAIVFMVQGNGCPIVRNALPRFKEIRDSYKAQGVEFLLINSNLQDNRNSITKEAESFNIDFPILIDGTQIIGEALGFVRTGEIFVVDPKSWKIAYQGPINDRLDYEIQRPEAKHHYLTDALDSMLAGEEVKMASVDAVGCLINLPGVKNKETHQQISYSDTVAPILRDNCVTCHRDGGIGPFAMTDYNIVRGFSPMIREVIRTKRMPPWHADPHFGKFANDRSLSNQEIQDVVHWVEAGSPRGEGPDPLAENDAVWPEWALGEPDLIIDLPATEVPASGIVDYQYPTVANPLDKDVWVSATEIIPGDRSALHHVIATFGKPNSDPKARRKFIQMGGLGGYVPGAVADTLPEGTGTFLPADATLLYQMHYTAYGKPTTDESRMGIYFHKEKPEHRLGGTFILNTDIRIPANTKAHTEYTSYEFKKDTLLYSLLPHSHFRGIASDFVATYPDGTSEMLLSVPDYDFNWQTDYEFTEPRFMPAGTKIEHSTTWDNSSQNPANPDPNQVVTWGEQSFEEMLFASMVFRYLDEEEVAQYKNQSRDTLASSGGK